MIYYKIKPEYDGKQIGKNKLLIANELYTEREFVKRHLPFSCATKLIMPKTMTYMSFGARFECDR